MKYLVYQLRFQFETTGIIFKAAAIGMPRNPKKTLTNHCCQLRGDVFANVPRNSTIIIWKKAVQASTDTNTQFFSMPLNTFIFSISLELISLKTWRNDRGSLSATQVKSAQAYNQITNKKVTQLILLHQPAKAFIIITLRLILKEERRQ